MNPYFPQKLEDELFLAVLNDENEKVINLIEVHGLSPNLRDSKRYATPLMYAASHSNYVLVKYFFLENKETDIQAQDCAGWTALHWACWGVGERGWKWIDSRLVISLMIQEDRELVKIVTHSGFTPFMMFVAHYSSRIDKLRDDKPIQPAITTSKEEKKEVFRLLLVMEQEADSSGKFKGPYRARKNNFGDTALDLANREDVRKDIISFIQQYIGVDKSNKEDAIEEKALIEDNYEKQLSETVPLIEEKQKSGPSKRDSSYYCYGNDVAKSKISNEHSKYFAKKKKRGLIW